MRLVFEDQGWEDYTSWLKTDRKMLARINKLIEDIRRDPFTGIGKPEPLKYHLPGRGHDALTTSTVSSTSSPKQKSSSSQPATTTDRSPRTATGKPERLKHLSGEIWSRRITEKDRLVYDFQPDAIAIIACSFHYDDH